MVSPGEGRAPHARKGATGLTRGMSPLGPGALINGCGRNEMPRHPCGLARRAHRVRPSEKSAFRIIPGSSTQGLSPRLGPFAEGRALHARNGGIGFTRACPRRRPGPDRPSRENVIPRHTFGHAKRAHRVRPSGKTTLRVMPGFSPLGHPCSASPQRRGGLRTPARGNWLHPGMSP
jgi:hypothetical protein